MMDLRRAAVIVPLVCIGGAVTYFTLQFIKKKKISYHRAADKELPLDMSKVHVVEDEKDWEKAHRILLQDLSMIKVLGFDCEWLSRDHHQYPVSLIQLASHSGICVLVRLCKFKTVPQSLQALLSDKQLLKVGVACFDDGRHLLRDHNLIVRGCVDLRYIALRSKAKHLSHSGLGKMADTVLGVHLNKSIFLRCSNWQQDSLKLEQVQYAARDALVGVLIFMELVKQSLPHQEGQTDKDVWAKILAMSQGIVDLKFGGKYGVTLPRPPKDSGNSNGITKTEEKTLLRSYSARKKPLYHNCQLQAPDGQLLCTCDITKAHWYISKGLGEKVCDDPFTVQLTFEPSGRPVSERNYYLQEKENVCVVCGASDSYIRKNVVPHDYRKYFPPVMKDHKSHDVVLMCTSCHQKSSRFDKVLRQILADKCAPETKAEGQKYVQDFDLVKVRSAAKALLGNAEKIPAKRKAELEELVCDYYNTNDYDEDMLQEAAQLDTKLFNRGYVAHGKAVVQYMREHEGLVELERMWRQHFLDTMKPDFMPALWSVDHSHERLAALNAGVKDLIVSTSPQNSSPDAL